MPLPVVSGGAPVGVPGAPPPGGPTGETAAAAGFDALFQQLTGRALAGALTSGAIAPDGEADAEAEASGDAEAAEPVAAVAVPVTVPVVPTPVEWIWTQPAPAPVDGPPAGEGTIDAAPVPSSPIGEVGLGSLGGAQPVARRGLPGETPVFAPVAAPAGREGSPVAAPVSRREVSRVDDATLVEDVAPAIQGPLPVAVAASPLGLEGSPVPVSAPTVPVTPGSTGVAPVSPGPVRRGPENAAPVAPPADPAPAPPSGIVASPEARPDGPALAPLPGAPGGDRAAETRALGEVRQGRARASAPEAAAVVSKETAAPAAAESAAPAEFTAPAIPVRRPLPAGALAAMERLAATPATPTGAAAPPVRTETNTAPVGAAATPAEQGGFQSGDGQGARGRDAGQPGPERAAAGVSFRVSDTPAVPVGVAAPLLERAAAGEALGAAAEMHQVRELEPALADAVHQQIVRSIRMQWAGGLGEARVSLKPEFLGEVTASINVERGVVTATLHADTPEVRTFIESHAATLRDALVEHGLRLDRLEVAEPERDAQTPDRQPGRRRGQQEAPPKPRRRDPESTATFDFVSE